MSEEMTWVVSAKNDDFTRSLFAMCAAKTPLAASRVGQFLLTLASAVSSNSNGMTPAQQQQVVSYDGTFGTRLEAVPTKCDQAQTALANADLEEQGAEASHEQNVDRVLIAATILYAGVVTYGAAVASRPVYVQQNQPAQINNYYTIQPRAAPFTGTQVPQAHYP